MAAARTDSACHGYVRSHEYGNLELQSPGKISLHSNTPDDFGKSAAKYYGSEAPPASREIALLVSQGRNKQIPQQEDTSISALDQIGMPRRRSLFLSSSCFEHIATPAVVVLARLNTTRYRILSLSGHFLSSFTPRDDAATRHIWLALGLGAPFAYGWVSFGCERLCA
jgi:hypothetical protein